MDCVLQKKSRIEKDFYTPKIIINDHGFPSGVQVMMMDKRQTSKWDPVYEAPFTILRRYSGGLYVLRDALGSIE